jgi:thiol-disulfide isomerase/thioredoxin
MVGETIPNFTAKDQFEKTFSLSQEKKKTVLVFIRGQWCPYCNKYVESLQNLAPELQSKNTRLVIFLPKNLSLSQKPSAKPKPRIPFCMMKTIKSQNFLMYSTRLKRKRPISTKNIGRRFQEKPFR